MFRYFENERGSALVALMLITAVLLIFGTALIANSMTEKRIAIQQELGTSLYYVAEAGLEEAIAVKVMDFDFTDDLESDILDGEGGYHVRITPDPARPHFEHELRSTGKLKGKELTLGAIVELKDLYEKAVLVSRDLTIEKTTIYGDLHCNDSLSIKGPGNKLYPYQEHPGELTFSGPDNKINWQAGGEIYIESAGKFYNSSFPFPDEWRIDPIPLPEIDLDKILRQHNFTEVFGNQTWRVAPVGGEVEDEDGITRQYLHVKGSLTISPAAGELFDFDGILIVDKDVEIKGSGQVNFEGMIVAKGDIFVKNSVNVGLTDKVVVLAADKEVKVFGDQNDCTESPVFGGDLLLFAKGNEVTIGHQNMKGSQFIMNGIIFAEKTTIYNCQLTYIAELSEKRQRYFPAYGMVVTSWFQPS